MSEHPLAAHAVGEVVGSIMESLGDAEIDLAVVFIEASHTGSVEDIVSSIHELLAPKVLIGSTACGVLAQSTEVEDRGAISAWAASGLDVEPMRLERGAVEPTGGWATVGPGGHVIALIDPFSSPVTEMLAQIESTAPDLLIHGGFASAAQGPGGNRLILGNEVFIDGGVAVSVSGPEITSLVAQGCRPIGQPLVVTGAEGNVITELASDKPMQQLERLARESSEDVRERMAAGLHVGIALDESIHEFSRGDFLIRGLLGADAESGAIAIGAEIPVGTTIQFHVRDAQTASEDLHALLDDVEADAVLTFTCNGRGVRLFGQPDHDADAIHTRSGSSATAGMFCAGELGPVSGRNHIHGFTASSMLFRTR